MQKPLENYREIIAQVSIKDAHQLSSALDFLFKRREQNLPFDKKYSIFLNQLAKSVEHLAAKQRMLPDIRFPPGLPVSEKREEIARIIQDNPVVILAGETGSGKTTQLPKICMSIGRGLKGRIGHTQPRRIAARTVANRIAEELQTRLGSVVGYQVRFADHTDKNTYVKLMTDGILLAEIQHDPLLLDYDTIIIDEAHERSLNIDFLLGYLKRLLPKRPELKIIVTSATIDVEKFSKHFNNAPIIEVSGQTYPVEVHYRPWEAKFEDINESIVAAVEEIRDTQRRGDILIFLIGEREIREASHALKKANFSHMEILPLYSRLNLTEQNKIFHPHKGDRIVLATNVAETSITVPGIKYVIDPGYARVSRYSVRTKVQRLPIETISQASANQRKGRCGRVSDGACYRLYAEDDFNTRAEFSDAEILRTNLAAVILQMLHMRIGDVRDFPFVDPPDSRLISDGFKLLEEIKAVNPRGEITNSGRSLSSLPLDPRLGAALLEGARRHCLKEVLIIAAALSIQDPRDRPSDKKQLADAEHRRFNDAHSDFVMYVNLWEYLEDQRQQLSQNQFRRLCRREFLSYQRVREWRDLHHQLRLSVKKLQLQENQSASDYESLHKALICGFLTLIGTREIEKGSREYLGTRQKKFVIFPGSSQSKKNSKWVLAAQFIETSQLFGHCVARVEPEWVLELAAHLSKKHYYEPHYDVKSGQVRVFARVSLLGLILQEKKSLAYSKVDVEKASNIFVREALVEGKYRGKGAFFAHNQQLITEVHELEAKSRRRDIMVNDEVIYDYYRSRLPQKISNLTGFDNWRKEKESKEPNFLYLSKQQLMLHNAENISVEQFPGQLILADYTLQVHYCFEPNKENDGVNLLVPIEILHDIPEHRLDWLVPGLLRDKCIALVKSLPKSTRKHFVPVPDFVDKVLPRLKSENIPLTEALADALGHLSGSKILSQEWNVAALDNFYRINIQIIDDSGKVVDQHRDLGVLKEKYRAQVRQTLAIASDNIERKAVTRWDFEKLPSTVELNKGRLKIKAYPALVCCREGVDLKVLDDPREAAYKTRFGVVRLAALECGQTVKCLRRQLLKGKDLGLSVANLGKREDVIDDLVLAAVNDAIFSGKEIPALKQQFLDLVEAGRSGVVASAERYERVFVDILNKNIDIKKAIKSHKAPLVIALAAGDINAQLNALIYPGFLRKTSLEYLMHYPRYLRGIMIRLEKVGQNVNRDTAYTQILQNYLQLHLSRLASEGEWSYAQNSQWQRFRWMIEELRVSFFAQTLKTQIPVSEKRIKKQWELSISGSWR